MAANHLKLVCAVAVLCMLVVDSMPMATAALTCDDVRGELFPCLSYVRPSGGNVQRPPKGCCDGVKSLNGQAQSKDDRQTVCRCLKGLAAGLLAFNPSLVESLPSDCGVNVPFKISTSTDCNRVNRVCDLKRSIFMQEKE